MIKKTCIVNLLTLFVFLISHISFSAQPAATELDESICDVGSYHRQHTARFIQRVATYDDINPTILSIDHLQLRVHFNELALEKGNLTEENKRHTWKILAQEHGTLKTLFQKKHFFSSNKLAKCPQAINKETDEAQKAMAKKRERFEEDLQTYSMAFYHHKQEEEKIFKKIRSRQATCCRKITRFINESTII